MGSCRVVYLFAAILSKVLYNISATIMIIHPEPLKGIFQWNNECVNRSFNCQEQAKTGTRKMVVT